MVFQNVIAGALFDALHRGFFAQRSGYQQKRYVLPAVLQFTKRLQAVPFRQPVVGQHHVVVVLRKSGDELLLGLRQRVIGPKARPRQLEQNQFDVFPGMLH